MKYWIPATKTQVVGAQVGFFIKKLIEMNFNTIDNFHLAGHSLGAHLVAYAAKFIKREMKLKIPRISGELPKFKLNYDFKIDHSPFFC